MLGLWLVYLEGGLGGWVDSSGSVAFPVDQFDSIFRYSRAPFFLVESQHVHMLKRVSFTFFFYSRVNNCMGRIVKYVRWWFNQGPCAALISPLWLGFRRTRLAIFSFRNSSNTYRCISAAAIWLLMSPMFGMSCMQWVSWPAWLSSLQFVAYLMASQLPRPHFVPRLWPCHPIDSIRSKNFNNNRTGPSMFAIWPESNGRSSRFPLPISHFPFSISRCPFSCHFAHFPWSLLAGCYDTGLASVASTCWTARKTASAKHNRKRDTLS